MIRNYKQSITLKAYKAHTFHSQIGFPVVNRTAIKGLALGVTLAWLTQLTGGYSFVTYGLMIFEKVGASKIDPFVASITIAAVQIVGSLMTTQL